MASDMGLNFRSTLAYVTDGSNDAAVLGETVSTTYSASDGSSVTGSWTTGTPTKLNRDSTGDARLAGMNYTGIGAGVKIFSLDLSTLTGFSAGTPLDFYAAHGDALAGWTPYVEYRDDTTVIGTHFEVATGGANRFDDSTGVAQTSQANWIANSSGDSGVDNKVTHTFASSSFRIAVGNSGATDLSMITHIRMVQGAAGRTTKNTRSWPLGTEIGMGFRMAA